ncbi:putative RNA-directed DNA polymerase [Lupinus albus]|uniref:Putative RNA-directed DNA polymerase n=1 Tax=Lupinus albus TaxID=3870 RepID=A0A6A4PHU1_LUPAL|nr:putative RNA-directed DNA polymerase [Lupinus albus]
METLSMKENFWREKSRLNWHTSGDRNTKFFHKVTKIRQVTKSMSLLRDEDNILTYQSYYFLNEGEGASGPGGFGGCFYKQFWDIVGMDVFNSVKQFFTQGWIHPNMNSNVVILIPKTSNTEQIEDYRPIALANFQFKIITKVLADRLALIEARIHECICIASEAINLLDHKAFGGNLAIKFGKESF